MADCIPALLKRELLSVLYVGMLYGCCIEACGEWVAKSIVDGAIEGEGFFDEQHDFTVVAGVAPFVDDDSAGDIV